VSHTITHTMVIDHRSYTYLTIRERMAMKSQRDCFRFTRKKTSKQWRYIKYLNQTRHIFKLLKSNNISHTTKKWDDHRIERKHYTDEKKDNNVRV